MSERDRSRPPRPPTAPRTAGGTTAATHETAPAPATGAGPVFARFARPRSRTPTRLAVLADAHLAVTGSGTYKLFERTEQRLRTALADAADRDADAVVVVGDLTRDGHPEEFDRATELLAESDVPTLAVPGNHDVPKAFDEHETPEPATFADRFADGLPFHRRVGGVDLVGLDTATATDGSLAEGHGGHVAGSDLDWLDRTLARCDAPVVCTHHNLAGLAPALGEAFRPSFPVGNHERLTEVLARHDAPLHCSGHLHLPALAERRGVRELVVPPLCSFPQAYLLLTVGPTGTTVRFVPVAGPAGTAEAYMAARDGSEQHRLLAERTAETLDRLPLVEETSPGTSRYWL